MQQSVWTLMLMVFLLGLRHGFDLDHLATIDAMTRNVRHRHLWARLTGFLFSLGHGLVVVLISLIVGSGLASGHIPGWLEGLGQGISVFFLFLFGVLTLWNLRLATPDNPAPAGIKQYLTRKLLPEQISPLLIAGVGALFALSFDTFSQVALFSLSASTLAGGMLSALFGLVFMIGMMVSDGLNGLFVSKLLQRADSLSIRISRLAGLLIGLFSLGIGVMGLIELSGAG